MTEQSIINTILKQYCLEEKKKKLKHSFNNYNKKNSTNDSTFIFNSILTLNSFHITINWHTISSWRQYMWVLPRIIDDMLLWIICMTWFYLSHYYFLHFLSHVSCQHIFFFFLKKKHGQWVINLYILLFLSDTFFFNLFIGYYLIVNDYICSKN